MCTSNDAQLIVSFDESKSDVAQPLHELRQFLAEEARAISIVHGTAEAAS